jgi:hypothetical protein
MCLDVGVAIQKLGEKSATTAVQLADQQKTVEHGTPEGWVARLEGATTKIAGMSR